MSPDKHLASHLPWRLPHWRLNRVTEMLRQRPQPLKATPRDDHPIRVYRLVLIEWLAEGPGKVHLAPRRKAYPAVCEAHRYHYSPDHQTRQEIEARLLTREPLERIASRLGADPKAIEYYASIFFHVDDALDHRDWVAAMIRSRMRYDEECGCSRAEAERGYVMRMFGYCGGPLVLDALINPLGATKPPENAGDFRTWSEEAVTQIARTLGTAAAATIELTGRDKMQLIRLAMQQMGERKTELGSVDDAVIKHFEAVAARFQESELP